MSADHAHALPAGYDLHEYRVVGMVGAGGFGITYRVYDVHLDKELALKEYLPNHWATRAAGDTVAPLSSTYAADYEWGLRRFLDEARTLARFNHPHLNRVHRFFEANGTGYMVLEYVGGETLAARLNRELRLPEEALRRLLEEVLSGLALVHGAGVVHRDIKPANLMLRAEDGGAVLLDFGAARQAVGRQSGLVSLVLTPGYAPIEQHAGEAGRMGPWTDIYALGMVAYRCLSGMRDDELPHSVARASAQHRGGEDLLAPAVEAGKGRYSLELLEAVDWAIKVDEEARPRRVEAWCEAWSGAGGRDTDEAGRARRRLEGQLDSLASSGVGGGGLRSVRRGGSVRGSRAAAGVRASEGEAASGGGGSAGVGGAGRRWGIRALALVVLVVYVMSAFRWMSVYGPEEDGLAMTETAEVTEPAQEEASAEKAEVGRLLAAAEADLAALRLTSPSGENAWEKYQAVLELDSGNPEALAGLERVIGSYMELLGAALEQGEFDKAAGYMERIRALRPGSSALEEGEQRLQAARQERAERESEEAARRAVAERARVVVGEMVSIPGGSFRMGDLSGEGGDEEKPVHNVMVPAFKLGKYEVTVDQFRHFVDATGYGTEAEIADSAGCVIYSSDLSEPSDIFMLWIEMPGYSWRDPGYAVEDNYPVACVSWNDAQAFIDWLNGETGGNYRFPSEAEWEYAARASSTTKYYFGNDESQLCGYANHADSSTNFDWRNESCSDGVGEGAAWVGRYQPNRYGLYDMYGNVWEWTQDCVNLSNMDYEGAPADGSAWGESGDCIMRVIRGGSWDYGAWHLRSAARMVSPSIRNYGLGFRLAQDD